ncbi:MAG: hypothetical protein H7296_06055 [Bacteroidia bacterium]|nr:hypothetical protein [Bacteroidia bacterium]
MKKIVASGIVSGFILLILSISGLYLTLWLFPALAVQYFDPAFNVPAGRIMFYYLHPFIVGMALSFLWSRFKSVLTGGFITRGIEFGLIYTFVAAFPMMWLIYSALNVSLAIVLTWLILATLQGLIAGLIFEKMNP